MTPKCSLEVALVERIRRDIAVHPGLQLRQQIVCVAVPIAEAASDLFDERLIDEKPEYRPLFPADVVTQKLGSAQCLRRAAKWAGNSTAVVMTAAARWRLGRLGRGRVRAGHLEWPGVEEAVRKHVTQGRIRGEVLRTTRLSPRCSAYSPKRTSTSVR